MLGTYYFHITNKIVKITPPHRHVLNHIFLVFQVLSFLELDFIVIAVVLGVFPPFKLYFKLNVKNFLCISGYSNSFAAIFIDFGLIRLVIKSC